MLSRPLGAARWSPNLVHCAFWLHLGILSPRNYFGRSGPCTTTNSMLYCDSNTILWSTIPIKPRYKRRYKKIEVNISKLSQPKPHFHSKAVVPQLQYYYYNCKNLMDHNYHHNYRIVIFLQTLYKNKNDLQYKINTINGLQVPSSLKQVLGLKKCPTHLIFGHYKWAQLVTCC